MISAQILCFLVENGSFLSKITMFLTDEHENLNLKIGDSLIFQN